MGSYLVKRASFVNGAWAPVGSVVTVDDDKVKDTNRNLEKVDGDIPALPNVQVSPVAPTGPNPTAPQQIPPDARQTIQGYEQPGARLVGEVTLPQEERIAAALLDEEDTAGVQGKLVEQLQDGEEPNPLLDDDDGAAGDDNQQNNDDALVAGTLADITPTLGSKSVEELNRLRAAEQDREKPRAGLLSAIDKELEARQG